MPTIDASIYNALLQPRKSAMDYADEYAAADDRQMARQFNALKMQEAQQGLQDQAGYRNALKAATGSDEERINALIRSGNPLAIKHGQEMQKALLDAQKVQADIGKTKAETGKFQGEAVDAALKRYRGALDFIDTPEGAKRWLQAQYSDPATAAYMQQLGPFEQAVTRIPTDPQGFQNWRGQAAMGMEKHMQQIRGQREYELKANNELIGPDGQVNQKVLNAKQSVARSGASNISLNTEKSLLGTVADNVGKDIVATSEGARSAQNTLSAVNRIRTALESGKAITGVGANQRVILGQIGETLGLGSAANQETLARTRDAIQGLAQLELEGAGSMKGQGQITEGERALLRKAASGDITMTAPELKSLMNTFERTANYRIGRNKSNVETLRKNPNAASVVPFLEANGQGNEDFTGGMAAAIAAEAARRAKLNGGR